MWGRKQGWLLNFYASSDHFTRSELDKITLSGFLNLILGNKIPLLITLLIACEIYNHVGFGFDFELISFDSLVEIVAMRQRDMSPGVSG